VALAGQRVANFNMYGLHQEATNSKCSDLFPKPNSIRRENTVVRFWHFRGGVAYSVWLVTDG
jgi:hypothetical protein